MPLVAAIASAANNGGTGAIIKPLSPKAAAVLPIRLNACSSEKAKKSNPADACKAGSNLFKRVGPLIFVALAGLASLNLSADFADRNWLQLSRSDSETGRTALITDLPSADATQLLDQLELFDELVDQFIEPFIPLAQKIAPELADVDRRSNLGELRLVVSTIGCAATLPVGCRSGTKRALRAICR